MYACVDLQTLIGTVRLTERDIEFVRSKFAWVFVCVDFAYVDACIYDVVHAHRTVTQTYTCMYTKAQESAAG